MANCPWVHWLAMPKNARYRDKVVYVAVGKGCGTVKGALGHRLPAGLGVLEGTHEKIVLSFFVTKVVLKGTWFSWLVRDPS